MAPSELAARLKTEVVTAMKAKDKDRLGVLRMLQAAVKQVEVDERRELDDADVVKILASYARKVKDQLASYGDGGRAETAGRGRGRAGHRAGVPAGRDGRRRAGDDRPGGHRREPAPPDPRTWARS